MCVDRADGETVTGTGRCEEASAKNNELERVTTEARRLKLQLSGGFALRVYVCQPAHHPPTCMDIAP